MSLARTFQGDNMVYPISNLLLEALPAHEKSELLKQMEPVGLPVGTVLFEADNPPRYVHFLTSGIASLLTVLSEGDAVEVGLVGREGLAEKIHLLGPQLGMTRCFMQIAGTALRVNFSWLQERFLHSQPLLHLIHRLVQYETLSLAQLSACNRLHEVEERLARWILTVQDKTGDPEMRLTQDFLGQMLGTRRSTVNIAAGTLQRAGFIAYRRSYLRVVDRQGLEGIACECYPIMKKLFDNIYAGAPHLELVQQEQARGDGNAPPPHDALRRGGEAVGDAGCGR